MDVIPAQWQELFKGLDIGVLVMLAVIAFALERAQRITDAQTVTILLCAGALWGGVDALRTYGAGTPFPVFAGFIFKGVLMNAGGAYLVAQGVNSALQKLGLAAPASKP